MPNNNAPHLVEELARDYTQSKFERNYLKKKIQDMLEFIIPHLNAKVVNRKEKEIVSLWRSIKEDKMIEDWFRKILEKVDRSIVIYVASKFTNNQYFGTKIIEEALKWK